MFNEKNLVQIKKEYSEGKIPKKDYLDLMLSKHSILENYSQLVKDSALSEIKITADSVIAISKRFGVKHVVVFGDVSNIPLAILDTGDYEKEEIDFILKIVRPGDFVFDVGANTGWVSMHIAKKYPDTVVHSFEPIPSTYSIFEKNLLLNQLSNVHLYKVALSDMTGVSSFYFNKGESGATSMRNIRETDKAISIDIKTERLDDFMVKERIRKLDFIKCDVEGAEMLVVKGGLNSIKEHKPIVFLEMLRKWSAKFNYHPNDIIDVFKAMEFNCYAIENKYLSLMHKMTDNVMLTNFFFVHKSREKEIETYIRK